MKVRDLVKLLEEQDQEATVYCRGWRGTFSMPSVDVRYSDRKEAVLVEGSWSNDVELVELDDEGMPIMWEEPADG